MNGHDKKWNMNYEKLVKFQRTNGHCRVPRGYEEDTSLVLWVDTQRKYQKKNELRLDRKELLDELGFVWKVDGWHQQHEKLLEFKRKNGHCRVPLRNKDDKSLGHWVDTQRVYHKKNKLRPDRKRILDEIGFVWKADHNFKPDDNHWHQQYEKLVEFKRKKGHCLVPLRNKEDVSLGMWVHRQRTFHKNNTIRLDRKELLDKIGFVWKAVPGRSRSSSSTTTEVRILCIDG
jgi:hemerythrin superfamily protein